MCNWQREDEEVVRAAVSQNGLALCYASEELRGRPDLVRAAVHANGTALRHASEELRGTS
jgi:G:T-mismatch repair DNA endonuclease (very short patch repair protein)